MKSSSRTKSLFALVGVSLALSSLGCAGADAADVGGAPAEDGSEDALTAQLLSGATAAEIEITPLAAQIDAKKVTVAQPKKMKKLTSAFKKAPANAAIPRCMPAYGTSVRFLDESAKEIAVLTGGCGYGSLKPKGGAAITVRLTGDIRELADAPLVPADALWGITKVEVNRIRTQERQTVTTPSDVAKLVAAIDGDQKIDPDKPVVKCLPTYTVGFKRKNDEVAYTSFICNAQVTPKAVTSELTIKGEDEDHPMARGAIDLDPRPFVALFD